MPGARPRPGRSRLSRSADFDRVFRHGRSHAGRELVLYVFPRAEEDGPPRLGLSVSRKVGGVVAPGPDGGNGYGSNDPTDWYATGK